MTSSKTKFVIVSRDDFSQAQLKIDGREIERVGQFQYLGTMLNNESDPRTPKSNAG